MDSSALIGGVGLTRVTVYDQRPAPDGLNCGCPHLHALTDEAYYVLEGTGEVEFFDAQSGLRKLDLHPGLYVHFPPLVLHRIINRRGLVILAIMGNAGLAERGDARIYFGPEGDCDPELYEKQRSLPERFGLEGALERRDLAVTAYLKLLESWRTSADAAAKTFESFIAGHLQSAQKLQDMFEDYVRQGPLKWGGRVRERLSALPAPHREGAEILFKRESEKTVLGMCGILHPVNTLTSL